MISRARPDDEVRPIARERISPGGNGLAQPGRAIALARCVADRLGVDDDG